MKFQMFGPALFKKRNHVLSIVNKIKKKSKDIFLELVSPVKKSFS